MIIRTEILMAFAFVLWPRLTKALQFPKFFDFKPAVSVVAALPTPTQAKSELLEAISLTDNGKSATPEVQLRVLELVRSLETKFPPSSDILSDPKEAQILDGTWFLQYTSPSDPSSIDAGEKDKFLDAWKPQNTEENIPTEQINARGSISAAGIEVDTSNRATKQSIDVEKKIVTNEVEQDWGDICVSGTFRQSEKVPNRAVVSFNSADITLKNGLRLKLGFLFGLIALIRGSSENGWLETTYVDESLRIGRGNKGTLFVLTRNRDDLKR